jgi:hypothetical protein
MTFDYNLWYGFVTILIILADGKFDVETVHCTCNFTKLFLPKGNSKLISI